MPLINIWSQICRFCSDSSMLRISSYQVQALRQKGRNDGLWKN